MSRWANRELSLGNGYTVRQTVAIGYTNSDCRSEPRLSRGYKHNRRVVRRRLVSSFAEAHLISRASYGRIYARPELRRTACATAHVLLYISMREINEQILRVNAEYFRLLENDKYSRGLLA